MEAQFWINLQTHYDLHVRSIQRQYKLELNTFNLIMESVQWFVGVDWE